MVVLGLVFWPKRSRSHECEGQQTRNPQCQGQAFLLVFGKQGSGQGCPMLGESIGDASCNVYEHDVDYVVELVCIQVGLDCEQNAP